MGDIYRKPCTYSDARSVSVNQQFRGTGADRVEFGGISRSGGATRVILARAREQGVPLDPQSESAPEFR